MHGVYTNALTVSFLGALALFSSVGAAMAQDAAAVKPPLDPQLEARMNAEKDARKQCKVDICSVFAARKAAGSPISCDMTKTFLADDISQKILSGKISWPWGNAQCTAHVSIDKALLAKLVAEPEATVKLEAHQMKCTVDRASADAYVLEATMTPEVTFKNGQAANVKLNWSNINAPLLVKGAIWSATTLDSAMNVMGNSAVTHLNRFMSESCKEVGVEIAQPK
jgi:hypothetical protein